MRDGFSGERLRILRQAHSQTLDQLGQAVGVSRQFMQQLERGGRSPSPELIDALAQLLEVEPRFFSGGLLPDIDDTKCSFRARRTTLVATRERVRSLSRLLLAVVNALEQYVSFPSPLKLKQRPASIEEAEDVANELRRQLGVARAAPLASMMRVAETTGAVVASFGDVSDKVDAFSVQSARPLIVHSTSKGSWSRTRFDVAHELGHLCMHSELGVDSEREEREADRFAGALLIPREIVRAEFPLGRSKWPTLFALKARWGISVSALVHRGLDCEVIGPLQYRTAQMHIRRQGWHRGEPNELVTERPESLSLAFNALAAGGIPASTVADHLDMNITLLESLTNVVLRSPPEAKVVSIDDRRAPNA